MKATTLLQNQHRQVEALFDAIEKADDQARPQLVIELATALAAHMVIEEETFYPMSAGVAQRTVLQNQEEHELAASSLERIVSCQPDEELLMTRLRVLRNVLNEHIEEEEIKLFPTVEKALDDAQLQAMGQQMKSRFDQLVQLPPAAVLAARPTAGMPCPGQKQQPTQQQPTQQQPGQQQPGQQPGQPRVRPGTRRSR